MFMSNAQFRAPLGVRGPILLWLNLDGREEIDELHREWHAAGAKLSGPPAAHPDAKLYEFFAEDLDGNFIRVFYDYAWEERETPDGDGARLVERRLISVAPYAIRLLSETRLRRYRFRVTARR